MKTISANSPNSASPQFYSTQTEPKKQLSSTENKTAQFTPTTQNSENATSSKKKKSKSIEAEEINYSIDDPQGAYITKQKIEAVNAQVQKLVLQSSKTAKDFASFETGVTFFNEMAKSVENKESLKDTVEGVVIKQQAKKEKLDKMIENADHQIKRVREYIQSFEAELVEYKVKWEWIHYREGEIKSYIETIEKAFGSRLQATGNVSLPDVPEEVNPSLTLTKHVTRLAGTTKEQLITDTRVLSQMDVSSAKQKAKECYAKDKQEEANFIATKNEVENKVEERKKLLTSTIKEFEGFIKMLSTTKVKLNERYKASEQVVQERQSWFKNARKIEAGESSLFSWSYWFGANKEKGSNTEQPKILNGELKPSSV